MIACFLKYAVRLPNTRNLARKSNKGPFQAGKSEINSGNRYTDQGYERGGSRAYANIGGCCFLEHSTSLTAKHSCFLKTYYLLVDQGYRSDTKQMDTMECTKAARCTFLFARICKVKEKSHLLRQIRGNKRREREGYGYRFHVEEEGDSDISWNSSTTNCRPFNFPALRGQIPKWAPSLLPFGGMNI